MTLAVCVRVCARSACVGLVGVGGRLSCPTCSHRSQRRRWRWRIAVRDSHYGRQPNGVPSVLSANAGRLRLPSVAPCNAVRSGTSAEISCSVEASYHSSGLYEGSRPGETYSRQVKRWGIFWVETPQYLHTTGPTQSPLGETQPTVGETKSFTCFTYDTRLYISSSHATSSPLCCLLYVIFFLQ